MLTLVLILTLTLWIFFYRLRPHLMAAAHPDPEAALEPGASDPPPAYAGLAASPATYSLCLEDHLQPPPSYQSLMEGPLFSLYHQAPTNLSLPKYLADSLQYPLYLAVAPPPAYSPAEVEQTVTTTTTTSTTTAITTVIKT